MSVTMKGGVTCLRSMFRRKMKIKNAIVDEPVTVEEQGNEHPPSSVENYKEVSVKILCGNERTATTTKHDVCSCDQGEAPESLVSEDTFSVPTPFAKLEFSDTGVTESDIHVTDRPMVSSNSEDILGEVEYEGGVDDDDGNDPSRPQEIRYFDSDRPLSDCASELTLNHEFAQHTTVLDNDSTSYYETSVIENYGPNMEGENSFIEIERASGHVSDPGTYPSKELESICSSPLLSHGYQVEDREKHGQFPKLVSLGTPSEPGSVRQPDSPNVILGHQMRFLSYESSSAGGEGRELASNGACGTGGSPKSDAADQYNENHGIKWGSSSEAVEAQKRKPWWKVFLVSHRNIHKEVSEGVLGSLSGAGIARMSHLNGYVSDVEARSAFVVSDSSEREQSGTGTSLVHNQSSSDPPKTVSTLESLDSGCEVPAKSFAMPRNSDCFNGKTGVSRVEEWVSNVHPVPPSLEDDQVNSQLEESPESPTASAASFFSGLDENHKNVVGAKAQGDETLDADVEMAKALVRSVNPLSTVAHFTGVGLKVVPSLGMFGSLRTLNLSANCFVRISPGCLPRSLHSLDISRNMLVAIEGLRELTRLRVLNLSFNRISRIGNGLSSCTSLKEVYLVGNKISEVEGLHRLSKLVVLDVSFNKLTTTKSLGQIAANYKSLQALNLLGNAVQSNLGDEQMRRFVTGICPQLVYLNKQALKSVSSREAAVDNLARAALGKDLKSSSKNIAKSSKRAGGHQSVAFHRGTHSGGAKGKSGGKGVLSPVLTGQEGHYRKAHHHNRGHEKATSSRELPKGFVPLQPTTSVTFELDQKLQTSRQGEIRGMPRAHSEEIMFHEHSEEFMFREDQLWSPIISRGVVQAH